MHTLPLIYRPFSIRIAALLLTLWLMLPALLTAQQQRTWTLRQCLEHARENNIALLQARMNMESSEVELARTKAQRLPNLNAGVGFGANFGYTINPFTNDFTSAGNQSLNGGLQSGVTLYNGGRIMQTIQQADLDLRASELDLKQAEVDLALNITLAYLDILRNAELVQGAELQLASTREQRDRTARLVEAGVTARADLLQLESQIATDELSLVNAENQLETAHLVLMQILRLDPSDPFGVERIEVDIPENDIFRTPLADIYQTATNTQPGVLSADIRIRSAEMGEKIAHTGLLPSLSASGSVGTGWASGRERFSGQTVVIRDTQSVSVSLAGGDYQELNLATSAEQPLRETYRFVDQLSDNINASVNLSLNIPIYNRRQNSASIQQAEIRRRQAELQAEQVRLNLEQTIQQAYVQARSAYSTYTSTMRHSGLVHRLAEWSAPG
ncbi:MAG: TolC family protein [Bacteroidetes bacterium]|nr:MAG: TolC family protein [Bacteroidota bacterium]